MRARIYCLVPPFCLQLLQVTISPAQYPGRKRELKVRVRDRDSPIEHPLDRFWCPWTILQKF